MIIRKFIEEIKKASQYKSNSILISRKIKKVIEESRVLIEFECIKIRREVDHNNNIFRWKVIRICNKKVKINKIDYILLFPFTQQ